MFLSESNMQHAISIPIMEPIESRSSTSSPKTTIESTSTQKTELSPPSSVGSTAATHGKKRKADGEEVEYTNNVAENLRTKLSYAMVKVQNGWQSNTLEEVESLASSPRSPITSTSPRFSLSAMSQTHRLHCLSTTSPSLAPPAPIISGRKRQNPNLQLKPKQPQRTPSQNAAMEADAVETLLFMSGSPNNSGRFPSINSFSPTSQTFSAQTSPLKEQFSPFKRPARQYENKSVLIDRLLNDLDDDMSRELDEAVRILERYRSRRKSSLT